MRRKFAVLKLTLSTCNYVSSDFPIFYFIVSNIYTYYFIFITDASVPLAMPERTASQNTFRARPHLVKTAVLANL